MNQTNQQVGVAFSRNAKRVVVFLAGFAIIAFAVGSELLLRMQAERGLTVRIEIFRAALALRDDDLEESVARLQSCTDGLIGVATLTESGTLSKIYPNDQEHIELAQRALANAGTTLNTRTSTDADPVGVFGALIDLPTNNQSGPSRRPALDPPRALSSRLAQGSAPGQRRRFGDGRAAILYPEPMVERQVVEPLRAFARLNIDPHTALTQLPSLESGVWIETIQIAKQFETLLRSLNDSDARVRRLEQESRRQILHKEVGFDLKLKRAKDEATIDALTKLRNRAFLECDLEPIFARQQERNSSLAAVMMDVDNFKRYNDTHGHQAGDSLLRFIGSLLRGGIRPIDYAVRYGGDEFLLLLPDIDVREAAVVADRLIKLFAQYAGQLSKECGVSIARAWHAFPEDPCENGHLLVKSADAALYAAKNGGKNSVSIGGEMLKKGEEALAFSKLAGTSGAR